MLGEKIDTQILMLISHDRLKMTEAEIDSRQSIEGLEVTDEDFVKFTTRSEGYFDFQGKTVLDVGCGRGELSNHLAKNGAAEVWGADLDPTRIEQARFYAESNGIENVHFVNTDFHEWDTDKKFDFVISLEAFDHIPDAEEALTKMKGFLKEDGRMLIFTAGFWQSPKADHCGAFLKFSIPWRQLIFNEKAMLKVRKVRFRPTEGAERLQDIRGGLSMYTFDGFIQAIRNAGLSEVAREVNYQFKYKHQNLRPFSTLLTSLPVIGPYFKFSLFSVLEKRQ